MSSSHPKITPRRPKFNFDNTPLVWSKHPEFAMIWNAQSTAAPYAEPYLNKVMLLAKDKLGGKDSPMAEEIDNFVRQEAIHYQMHIRFNERFYKAGYDVKEQEAALKADYDEMLGKRSLAFNAGYCTGFENFTLFTAKFMFETADDLFEGAEASGGDIWLWHLAEEFEHRCVAHNVFAAVSGNYFMRIYGTLYSYFHLNKRLGEMTKITLGKFRAGMSDEERAASLRREKEYKSRYARFALPRMLAILVPFYDPARYKTSKKIDDALAHYAAMSA